MSQLISKRADREEAKRGEVGRQVEGEDSRGELLHRRFIFTAKQ